MNHCKPQVGNHGTSGWLGWAVGVALASASIVAGCGNDGLESATSLDPPDPGTDGFDPTNGNGDGGGYYSTGGPDSDGDGDSAGDGGSSCEDEFKRCAHEFSLADEGYSSVSVFGDFAPGGWESGVPMALIDGVWTATLPISWGEDTQYKFSIDGGNLIPDPGNAETVPDGNGGENSVVRASMCADYTCEPGVQGTFDWRDSVIYFIFVDRFFNADPSNDNPIGVPELTDWQGGDWAGVTQKIEEGYFEDLGVNTLWISVPLDNTNESGLGKDGRDYSAYHAYWPTRMQQTEEHFGTLEELQTLVDTAHEHDLKVLFDYAMNHVHASSPVYMDNPNWFWPNDNGSGGDCVCGVGCSWDGEQGKRCWFESYLPDFNFNEQGALDFSLDNVLWWIEQTQVDGLRVDAVKHIEDAWLLDLRVRLAEEVEMVTGERFYMVGETFTGNRDTIAYYVNPDMLDGQFDFPLRMEIARTLLMRNGSMTELADFMDGNDSFYGSGIMSTFIGNHDIPRVIHSAQDTPVWSDQWADGKERAWENRPGLPSGTSAFERMATGFALILTTKGAPLIYYGDEWGMPGAGDPDNRRFMQWEGYSAGQQLLNERLRRLLEIRAAHPATRRGTRTTIDSGTDFFAYEVTFGGDRVYVAINRSDASIDVGGFPSGALLDELAGEMVQGPTVSVPARSARVMSIATGR